MTELWLMTMQSMEGTECRLDRYNGMTEGYGLALTQAQLKRLEEGRREALRTAGRVEFGEGALSQLIPAFRDSPYLEQRNYEEVLCQLQELFYLLKNRCGEGLSDEELAAAMRLLYDGPAGGSLDFLASVSGEDYRKIGRSGSLTGTEWEEALWHEDW